MINLKNVSKFYYRKGMITSGITKVNLQLDLGEFVVITGESGSGKSTLLNVISGLDTYEEGEMYIDGRETSHFMEKDFVDYRKKYIGNIFQSFNLVNSYTVYQNVELILLINGYKRADIKNRVREILDKVGMLSHAGVKASKLSGGQKQRVAIARALAKNTDIIVADEPTGNLDSESAAEIVKLLSDIAAEKLVIVVTHNYEQFKAHATRKIKMHDGKIVEDVRLGRGMTVTAAGADGQESAEDEKRKELRIRKSGRRAGAGSGKISLGSKVRLGVRNTFNVVPKFLLLLLVFIFVLVGVTSQYTAYLSQKQEAEGLGYNSYFTNLSLDRMVVKKDDGSRFTEDDYQAIKEIFNVRSISEYDVLLDNSLAMESGDFYYDAIPRSIYEFKDSLIAGRMPAAANEVLLASTEDDYYFSEKYQEKNLNREYTIDIGDSGKTATVTVVGLAYKRTTDTSGTYNTDVYMTNVLLNNIMTEIYHANSTLTVDINGKEQTVERGDTMYNVVPDSKVKSGKAIVSEEVNNYYTGGKCEGKKIKVNVNNLYYDSRKSFKISGTYTDKTFRKMTGFKDYEQNAGAIFINPDDYNELFTHDNYQSTIYVKDTDTMDDTRDTLQDMGYEVLPLKDVLVNTVSDARSIIQLPITIIVIIALFFVAYFVIRLILRSRSGYFTILRMLGLRRRAIRRIMDVEMTTVILIAFALFMGVAALSTYDILSVKYINELIKYMEPVNYGILLGVVLVMGYFISGKFVRSLFKDSAMGTYREGE